MRRYCVGCRVVWLILRDRNLTGIRAHTTRSQIWKLDIILDALHYFAGRCPCGESSCDEYAVQIWTSVQNEILRRKLGEKYREMGRNILQILNEEGNFKDSAEAGTF